MTALVELPKEDRVTLAKDLIRQGLSTNLAGRVVDGAVAYLNLCAKDPGKKYSPSKAVDMGWHALEKRSEIRERFHEGLGVKIKHVEAIVQNYKAPPFRTIDALHEHGLPVDKQIWNTIQAGCYDDETNDDGGPN